MIDLAEMRKGWRTNWLSCIQEFADFDTQYRMWLDRSNINPHWSFVEIYCCYFDNLGLSVGGYRSAIEQGLVNAEEVEAVLQFHAIADAYRSPTNDYDHIAILDDPKWKDVVAAAKQAQLALKKLLKTPDEIELLLRP